MKGTESIYTIHDDVADAGAAASSPTWQQQQQQLLQKSSRGSAHSRSGSINQQRCSSTTVTLEEGEGGPQVTYQLQLRPSIFYLPVLSPEHQLAWFWSLLMLVMDMGYIAFIMPLFMAFCPVVFGELNWCGTVDLVAGECGWLFRWVVTQGHLGCCCAATWLMQLFMVLFVVERRRCSQNSIKLVCTWFLRF